MARVEQPNRPLYRYCFDDVRFDESRAALYVAGQPVEIEQRPLQVLGLLLQHVDEVVTRAALFETVWEGRPTVDNVLANAIAKLRKALGANAAPRIVNLPRVGYRLRGPVERSVAGHCAIAPFKFEAGCAVPGHGHFRLMECLGSRANGLVWRVRHDRTGETRVYKFAADGERLSSLKREVTIQRMLREKLGERDDFARLIDWNFDTAPYWLQCEDAGTDLARWSRDHPAFAQASLEQRIAWFVEIAGAVAAAHEAGVLHRDVKPANVLVAPHGHGWRFRVADFGSGRLREPGDLERLGITGLGLTVTCDLPAHFGVTLLYLAPEILAGAAPSVKSDVYALGLILFQMIVGDFRRMLAPGWREGINDELAREDIAAAAEGDPERRLASVDELVLRLRRRNARAAERRRLHESDARALAAERLLERSRARRPWLLAAIVLLALGLTASVWQNRRVHAARIDADHQAALADATNRFLNDDLLGAGIGGNPPAWRVRNPSLREILDTAAQRLGSGRFATEPVLLANLHQTLGRVYTSMADFKGAVTQLQAAASGLGRALGESNPRSVLAHYELATALAHLSRFDAAGKMLDRADAMAGPGLHATSEMALRSHLAHADVAYQQMRVRDALAHYAAAEPLQRRLHPDDAMALARILTSIADCDLATGKPRQAEAIARKVLAGEPYTEQRVGIATLAIARSRLADALRAQGKDKAAAPDAQPAVARFEASEGVDGWARPAHSGH